MSETFLALSRHEQRDALLKASGESGRPAHLLEKDVWVVWALKQLFASSFASHLVFKGGTSLSKAYGVIDRFSEDVDVTYDIRAIASDLIDVSSAAWIPATRSQQEKLSDAIRKRVPVWLDREIVPCLTRCAQNDTLPLALTRSSDVVLLQYEPILEGTGYSGPTVRLEFGGRATGEPAELVSITCDAAVHLPMLVFPDAAARAMRPERTFWEKATAVHVFCRLGKPATGERFSRHYHDLLALDTAGYAERAFANRDLAREVARHKAAFFREKLDYHAAVEGDLQLVPAGNEAARLADDYQAMIADGLLMADAAPFAELIELTRDLERRANAIAIG